MSTQVLPKKRNRHGEALRYHSGVQDLANRGRVISGRSVSKSKRVISNRGDLFDNEADSSLGDDAINFDQNKNTIMSNFEEWIKLSTDNKITTKNSWQFALIDYFHDLNVIKDGDDINFQKASATLDGCVKIYSSRVESVATETGKLLSGLANKKNQEGEAEEDEEEQNEDEENENGETRKTRKINRVMESTLVSFDTIRIKKLDQELSIDPLFKKALAEFDEGGAKSLLLNTLNIDKTGRVVFDATTNGNKADQEQLDTFEDANEGVESMNFDKLESILFKQGSLDELDVCPSIEQLKVVLNDIDKAKSILSDVNNKFSDNNDQGLDEKSISKIEDAEGFDFNDYNDNNFNDENFDLNDNDNNNGDNGNVNGDINEEREDFEEEYELGPGNQILDQDLMAYFDETMKSNWRGPEHWKVSAYKKSKNIAEVINDDKENLDPNNPIKAVATAKTSRAKKEVFHVNFFEDDEDIDEDILFSKPNNLNALKKKELTIENRLPEDIQYNSTRLITLFLKPDNNILYYPKVRKTNSENQFTDESYFAEQYNQQDRMASFRQAQLDEINQDYEDEGDVFGGIDFNDALEESPMEESAENDGNNKNNLLIGGRKVRPEYVNFSRIAKRVDIKLLKDNLWKGIKEEVVESPSIGENSQVSEESQQLKQKNFGDLVDSIGKMYSNEEKKDLSTSFCFICLLHLANEHSLTVTSTEAFDDLKITGF